MRLDWIDARLVATPERKSRPRSQSGKRGLYQTPQTSPKCSANAGLSNSKALADVSNIGSHPASAKTEYAKSQLKTREPATAKRVSLTRIPSDSQLERQAPAPESVSTGVVICFNSQLKAQAPAAESVPDECKYPNSRLKQQAPAVAPAESLPDEIQRSPNGLRVAQLLNDLSEQSSAVAAQQSDSEVCYSRRGDQLVYCVLTCLLCLTAYASIVPAYYWWCGTSSTVPLLAALPHPYDLSNSLSAATHAIPAMTSQRSVENRMFSSSGAIEDPLLLTKLHDLVEWRASSRLQRDDSNLEWRPSRRLRQDKLDKPNPEWKPSTRLHVAVEPAAGTAKERHVLRLMAGGLTLPADVF